MQVDLDIRKTPNNVRLLITEENHKKPKKGLDIKIPLEQMNSMEELGDYFKHLGDIIIKESKREH